MSKLVDRGRTSGEQGFSAQTNANGRGINQWRPCAKSVHIWNCRQLGEPARIHESECGCARGEGVGVSVFTGEQAQRCHRMFDEYSETNEYIFALINGLQNTWLRCIGTGFG